MDFIQAVRLKANGISRSEKPPRELNPVYLVRWDQDDPMNPHNWSDRYKWWVTFQLGMLALASTLGSSIQTPADATIAKYVGVSREVSVLEVTMYLYDTALVGFIVCLLLTNLRRAGYMFGPVIWAPISEIWGRRVSMLPAVFIQVLFALGTSRSTNAASVFITRFFAGFFGSAPTSNVMAALDDIWGRERRGVAVSFYAVAVNGGASLGPLIGSALVMNDRLDWRWTGYILAIWLFVIFAMAFFFLPEMYPLLLLKQKAQRLRKETGEQRYYHPHEHMNLDIHSIVTKQFSRPLLMLFTEPVVSCIAMYAAFVYGVFYITLEVFPIVFREIRGWHPVVAALPFLALLIGVICSVWFNIWNQARYNEIARNANGRAVPEARLFPMAFGAVFFVIATFWFAWTANPPHHWILPCLAALLLGLGFDCIFQQCLNYLIDMYGMYAASAIAAVAFLRSIMAAGLPLAARPMIRALDVGPAVSIIGAVAAALMPIPFLFMKYGARLRSLSKLRPESPA